MTAVTVIYKELSHMVFHFDPHYFLGKKTASTGISFLNKKPTQELSKVWLLIQ